jgi:Holliday junction resolvase
VASTQYQRGQNFEHQIRKHLAGHGYEVLRSAGSKTKIDLVGFKRGEILLVQCKRDGRCPPGERAELLRIAALVGAVPLVAGATGPRGARVEFRRLVAPGGPKDWASWSVDPITETGGAA